MKMLLNSLSPKNALNKLKTHNLGDENKFQLKFKFWKTQTLALTPSGRMRFSAFHLT